MHCQAACPTKPNNLTTSKLRNLRPPLHLFPSSSCLFSHKPIQPSTSPIHHTETVAIMGYTDVDKLAINTIRLLAVSSILAIHVDSYPSIRRKRLFCSASTAQLFAMEADMCSLGRCHLQGQLGPSRCPYVSCAMLSESVSN